MQGVLLAILLTIFSFGNWTPQTPRGIQCPTAAVQSISETVFVEDCCGNLVPQTITRKPKLGEKEFLQCRCAEKRAAETHQKAKSTDSSLPLIALAMPLTPATLQFSTIMLGYQAVMTPAAHVAVEWIAAPPTPPPQLV